MHGLPKAVRVFEDCSLTVQSQTCLVKGACIGGVGN